MGGSKRKKKTGEVSPNSADVTASTPEQLAKRQRNQGENQADDASVILSRNPYSILSDATAINMSDLNGFGDDQSVGETSVPAKVKLPPIVVKSIKLDKLANDLQSMKIDAEFKLCRIGIKVVLRSLTEFNKVKVYLDKRKAEYFTHDVAAQKPFKAVVRGLPYMNPEFIASELKEKYKLEPLQVYPMSRKEGNHQYRDCLYLIHFKKGTVTLGALKAVRSLHRIIVTWEAYRGARNGITQCMRCLHFGHGTRNCRVKARCNLCAQQHETKDCTLNKEEAPAAFKCANCDGNHRASDRTCTKRDEYKSIRTEASSKGQPGHRLNRSPSMKVISPP